ncbi:hypothetical protein [Caballeronia fortuita]|uniref:hypothetical protein n=1 Tax=Caballeronia fortuita TaxID=1777138 RepID=UPI0012FD12A2|nr:hypothetical protein [Caballeronia fortuita]
MLTKGAETALRAVEAARGVTRHFQEPREVARVRWFVRPRAYGPRLPAPVSASNGAAVLGAERSSSSILATIAMAIVVLGLCFIARAYFEQRASTARASAMPVAAAGVVRPAAPKADIAMPNLDSADRLADGAARDASRPPVEAASALIAVTASSKDSVHQGVVAERSVDKKLAAPVAKRVTKTASKSPSKAATKTAAKTSKVTQKTAAVCARKSDRGCAERTQRHASKPESKQRQTRAAPRAAPAVRAKSDEKEFQKVAAIPQPVRPAMTADDSWRPGKSRNKN